MKQIAFWLILSFIGTHAGSTIFTFESERRGGSDATSDVIVFSNDTMNETTVNATNVTDALILKGSLKKTWANVEWVEWMVPGPLMTIISTLFVGYTCGPTLAFAALPVLAATDLYVFYFSP